MISSFHRLSSLSTFYFTLQPNNLIIIIIRKEEVDTEDYIHCFFWLLCLWLFSETGLVWCGLITCHSLPHNLFFLCAITFTISIYCLLFTYSVIHLSSFLLTTHFPKDKPVKPYRRQPGLIHARLSGLPCQRQITTKTPPA